MKYLASVVSLIALPKTLIWNKITFPASNSLNSAELVENELIKSIFEKIANIIGLLCLCYSSSFLCRIILIYYTYTYIIYIYVHMYIIYRTKSKKRN